MTLQELNQLYLQLSIKDKRFLHVPFETLFRAAKAELSKLATSGGIVENHTHQAEEILYRYINDPSIFTIKDALDKLLYVEGSATLAVTYGYTEYGNARRDYTITSVINRELSQISSAYLYYSNNVAAILDVKNNLTSLIGSSSLNLTLSGELPMQGDSYLKLEVHTVSGEIIIGSVYIPFRYRSYVGCTSVDYLSQNDPIMYSNIGVTTRFLLKGTSNISLTPTVPATKFIFAYPLVMGNCEIKYGNFIMQLPYKDIDIIGPYDTITYRFYQSEYSLNVSSNYTFTIN